MRSPHNTAWSVVLVIGVAVGLAACDTGDGKQLQPVDPDSTTTSTVAPLGDDSFGTGPLPSVPLDQGTVDAGAFEDGTFAEGTFDELGQPDLDQDSFELFTPWVDGSPLDARYTCDGDDIAPSLSWKSPPAGTVQLAFAMVDESTFADDRPYVHWALAGVDPTEVSLTEGVVPLGAVQAENSAGTIGWTGPCPPEGDPAHIYRFTMYALNQQVELADGTAANDLLDYIDQLAISSTDVTATYQR